MALLLLDITTLQIVVVCLMWTHQSVSSDQSQYVNTIYQTLNKEIVN